MLFVIIFRRPLPSAGPFNPFQAQAQDAARTDTGHLGTPAFGRSVKGQQTVWRRTIIKKVRK